MLKLFNNLSDITQTLLVTKIIDAFAPNRWLLGLAKHILCW